MSSRRRGSSRGKLFYVDQYVGYRTKRIFQKVRDDETIMYIWK